MISITIDGPAGAGKSTTAKIVAQKLGIKHLNTGAMYRALAVKLNEMKIDCNDALGIDRFVTKMNMQVRFIDDIQHVIVNGDDVTDKLYTNAAGNIASFYSANFCVRQTISKLTRDIANEMSIILDGRDSGSYVLPNATYKFYLDSDPLIRAKRRFNELIEKGENVNLNDIHAEILRRDEFDKGKKIAPLVVPKGAVVIDNSTLDAAETAEQILQHIKLNG